MKNETIRFDDKNIEILLNRMSRLASVTFTVEGMSYDADSPLNAVKMAVDGILYWNKKNNSILPGVILDQLQIITIANEQMRKNNIMLRDILESEGEFDFEEVNLIESVDRAVRIMKDKSVSENISLNWTKPDNEIIILTKDALLMLTIIDIIHYGIYSIEHSGSDDNTINIQTELSEKNASLIFEFRGHIPENIFNENSLKEMMEIDDIDNKYHLTLFFVDLLIHRINGDVEILNRENDRSIIKLMFNLPEE